MRCSRVGASTRRSQTRPGCRRCSTSRRRSRGRALLAAWFGSGDASGLDAYSETCLRRVWRVQHFSWWMTSMLHRFPGGDPFDAQLQRSQLRYVISSRAAATTLAENYVGLEHV